MTPELSLFLVNLLIIVQVIWVDGILSIDNAAALAVLAEPLPDDQPAPRPLHWKWLGSQRQCALKLGMWMAFIFRGLLLIGAVWLLTGPIHVIGGILGALWLFWLVYRHFFSSDDGDPKPLDTSHFWKFIFWIEITDLTFSWDNISAVAALSTDTVLLIVGMCISVAFIRFAATTLIPVLERVPELAHAAY